MKKSVIQKSQEPRTVESVDVPGKKVLYFKVGEALKKALNAE